MTIVTVEQGGSVDSKPDHDIRWSNVSNVLRLRFSGVVGVVEEGQ